MNTKKIVIKPAPRGYTQIDLPVKKTVRISNMFIPFGMNSNYTIKLQFSKENTPVYETLKSFEKEQFKNVVPQLETHIGKKAYQLMSKCQQKGSYPPTLMCTVAHKKDSIQTIIHQKHKGAIDTIYNLEKYTVDAVIEINQMWEKNGQISLAWIVKEIQIKI